MVAFLTTPSVGLTSALVAAVGVRLSLLLLRKLNLYRPQLLAVPLTDQQLQKYRRWDLTTRMLLMPFAFVLAYVCCIILCAIEHERAALLNPADFVLTPVPVLFALPSLLAGILLASIPLKLIATAFLGRRGFEELLEYSNRKLGVNGSRLFKHQVYVFVPLMIISVALGLQNYVTVTEQSLVFHPYFALHARTYHWDDIRRIVLIRSFKAPNGQIRRNLPYYILELNDGVELNFHRSLLKISISEQTRLASFVATHAGRSVEINDPYPQLKAW